MAFRNTNFLFTYFQIFRQNYIYLRCLSPINVLLKKAIIDRSDDTDFASDCDTDCDLTDNCGEIEEIEESNSDSTVDESNRYQVDANTAIGGDSCTMWYDEHPRIRRDVHQNVPHERAGVHVAVPTLSVSATFSFFFMDEM